MTPHTQKQTNNKYKARPHNLKNRHTCEATKPTKGHRQVAGFAHNLKNRHTCEATEPTKGHRQVAGFTS